nr:hypothetical protein [uncultured bacterium]
MKRQIPDICKNSSLLATILYTQLFVLLFYLLIDKHWSLDVLGYYTIYSQWVVLGSLFLVCQLRKRINRLRPKQIFAASAGICFLVFVIVEIAAQWLSSRFYPIGLDTSLWIHRALAAILIIFLLHRLILLLQTLEERSQAESQARMQALQSRIRPHFLFNSLNTIAELTATAPQQAEQAIYSLSLLFRAGMENIERSHTLDAELNLCKRYLELEHWRLAEKLDVTINISVAEAERWQVPKLMLQPLVENAVVHGARADGSISLEIDIKETAKHISILIKNSIGAGPDGVAGNGMAVENVRERLFVMYDDDQSFKVRQSEGFYQVIMRIPKKGHWPSSSG